MEWCYSTAKPEQKEMLCSESYMDNHQVLIVPANSKIKSLKDITKDTEVGIQSGSTAADAADSAKELKRCRDPVVRRQRSDS